MNINEIQDEIIEEFSGFDDWMDKYQLLIDLGNEQEPLDEKYKVESNLIDGCQSRVWLQADLVEMENEAGEMRNVIHFQAESDALIVKGIVCQSLFHRTDWSARTPLSHAQQRSAGYGEADAYVRTRISSKRRGLIGLIGIEFLQTVCPEVTPSVIRGNARLNGERCLFFV